MTHRRPRAGNESGSTPFNAKPNARGVLIGRWRRDSLILTIIAIVVCVLALQWQPNVHATTATVASSSTSPAPVAPTSTAPATSSTPTTTPAATPTPSPITLSAQAAYAVDVTNDSELYAQNADTPLAPASTTKIVTAIVVMKHASPDETVTIQPDDQVDWTVYSHMGLLAGDVVTVRELLAGMLLNSGGDAAMALSRYVGEKLPSQTTDDPRQRFVDEMNRVASQIGMSHSHFNDPDGRDTPGHVSTAHDLALAASDLFSSQLLQTIVGTTTETVSIRGPNARDITLVNTNEFLGNPDVHGVKTGTTDNAGECLVLAVSRGDDRVITVVLGSTDRYGDTSTLLNYLDAQFKWVRLGRGGDLQDLNTELQNKGYSLAVSKTVLLSAVDASHLHYILNATPKADDSPFASRGDVVFLIGSRPIWRLSLYAGDPFKPSG